MGSASSPGCGFLAVSWFVASLLRLRRGVFGSDRGDCGVCAVRVHVAQVRLSGCCQREPAASSLRHKVFHGDRSRRLLCSGGAGSLGAGPGCRSAACASRRACGSSVNRWRPNNSFKPNLLRYSKIVAEKACHAFASTTQVGLIQALGCRRERFLFTEKPDITGRRFPTTTIC